MARILIASVPILTSGGAMPFNPHLVLLFQQDLPEGGLEGLTTIKRRIEGTPQVSFAQGFLNWLSGGYLGEPWGKLRASTRLLDPDAVEQMIKILAQSGQVSSQAQVP